MQLMTESLKPKTNSTAFFIYPSSKRKASDFDIFEYIDEKTGVNFEERSLSEKLSWFTEVYLLFDEGHKYFGKKFDDFWEAVVKRRASPFTDCSTKVIVIVSTTHYLSPKSTESPVSFRGCARLEIEDLRFTPDEANELFELWSPTPFWTRYRDTLFSFTNGTSAQFAAGLNLVLKKLGSADHRADSQNGFSEEDLLEILVEGSEFMEELTRCYASKAINRAQHDLIFNAVVAAYEIDAGKNPREIDEEIPTDRREEKQLSLLKRSDILLKNLRFASPAAARFYFSILFPRASLGSEAPTTLEDLVRSAVKEMSAKRLRTSRQVNSKGELQTPKEAVFQQLFHEAIYLLLPLKYRIVAEFGTSAKVNGEKKTGELDFYIRNGRRWDPT